MTDTSTTYLIRRFTSDESNRHNREVIRTGLTLEDAQEHCNAWWTKGDDAEHGGPWFDGYEEE